MDAINSPNALALQSNPFVQALQILYGRTDMQMNQLKGVSTPIDKAVKLDNIENNLSRIFVGYADIQMDRQTKYRDYDRMDVTSTEAQVGLDIYAEESSQLDSKTGLAVWAESQIPEIAAELNGMLQRVKMESKAYGILRNIAKYGDVYTFNILGSQGVHGIQFIHPSRVERIQQDGLQGFSCPDLTRALPPDNKNNMYKPWDFCTDNVSEILTETRGWQLFKDLLPEDKVATRNPETKELEWQQPTDYVNSPYSGEMVKIKSRSIDLLVTPNHRMLVTEGTHKEEKIISAEELANSNKRKHYFKIPMTSSWIGTEIQERVFNKQVGKSVTVPAISIKMSGDDYAAFMGMYLSEGHCGDRGQIVIGQNTESKGYIPYKKLLEQVLDKDVHHNGKWFAFSRSVLGEFLASFGLSEEKYIPQDIMNATPRQIQIFWDYYMLGDGSLHKRTTKTTRTVGTRNGVYTSIHTTSKILAGQLQEIAQKLGLSASVWTRPAYVKTRKKDGKTFECKESYAVAVRHSASMSFSTTKEHYEGTVHCVTVSNGIIYVRRNGKPAWTGNCHFRLVAYDQESMYGRSMLECIRKTWKSFQMLETMVVIYRLTKAVQRNIFYVDVGQASVEESQDLVQKYDKFLKNKTVFIDQKSGDFKMDFSPATMLQDIIWPVRPGSASKVEPLQNTMNIGPLVDLEHFATKMRIGLGIPKTYFDGEQDPGWNSRDALMLQDARFGRKIAKIQKSFIEGVTSLCQIHYAIAKQQYLPTDAFQVKIGTMNASAERDREETLLRKAQLLEILINVAISAGWNREVWSDYLLDEIYPLPMEYRKKLFTPDPVEERQAKLLVKAGKPAKVGSNSNIGDKPKRTVTNTGIKFGFKQFGEEEQLDDLTPELIEEFIEDNPEIRPVIEELNKMQIKEALYEDLKNTYASPYGFSKDEIQELIDSSPGIATQLNETTKPNQTDWAKKTSWKSIYELGLNPNPQSVNSIND